MITMVIMPSAQVCHQCIPYREYAQWSATMFTHYFTEAFISHSLILRAIHVLMSSIGILESGSAMLCDTPNAKLFLLTQCYLTGRSHSGCSGSCAQLPR
jgi:hypothetical protein